MFGTKKQFSLSGPKVEASPQKQIESTTLILLIERDTLSLVEARVSSNEVLLSAPETCTWNKDTLTEKLQALIEGYETKSLRLIIGQDLATVSSNLLQASTEDKATQALITLHQDQLGDAYESFGIDFYTIGQVDDDFLIQSFMVKKSLLSLLGEHLKDLGLDIVSIEPLAACLKVSQSQTNSYVVLWGEQYLYASFVLENEVVQAQVISGENVYKQINSLISLVESQYSIELSTIYLASTKLDMKTLKKKKKNVSEVELNPFEASISNNEEFAVAPLVAQEVSPNETVVIDDETEDMPDDSQAKSAIIESQVIAAPTPPLTIAEKEPMDSITTPDTQKSNTKLLAVIITVVVVLVGMVVGGFFVYQNAMKEAGEAPQIVTTQEAVPTPEATPEVDTEAEATASTDVEELDVASLEVRVLNGSGTPGQAGKVASLLEKAGFESIDTGNADSFDFQETEIQVKEDAVNGIYQAVLTAIQDDYETTKGSPLSADSDFDIVITVGKL